MRNALAFAIAALCLTVTAHAEGRPKHPKRNVMAFAMNLGGSHPVNGIITLTPHFAARGRHSARPRTADVRNGLFFLHDIPETSTDPRAPRCYAAEVRRQGDATPYALGCLRLDAAFCNKSVCDFDKATNYGPVTRNR